MGFYQTNSKILSKSIKGADTIDFNKYPDLLDILFNHWISQKENYNRLRSSIQRGEFEISRSIVMFEFGIKETKAKNLIKRFVDDEIIKLKKRGNSSTNKSTYVYLSALERSDNGDFEKTKLETKQATKQRLSKTAINQYLEVNEKPNKDQVKDQATTDSKKELIKKNYKKDIYSEIAERFNSTCSGLSKVIKVTDKRKKVIDARLKEYDQETIYKVFDIASSNRFLNGDNNRGWKADFDWLINPNNFIKVLEGNYSNQEQQIQEEPKEFKSKIDYSKMTPEEIMELGSRI